MFDHSPVEDEVDNILTFALRTAVFSLNLHRTERSRMSLVRNTSDLSRFSVLRLLRLIRVIRVFRPGDQRVSAATLCEKLVLRSGFFVSWTAYGSW